MHSSTYLSWFRRLLILGAIVAGLAASAAGARLDPGPPPDVRDVAASLSATPATIVARPPDISDAAASASGLSSGIEPVYEHQLHSPATASQSVPVPGGSDFAWGDWAIGVGAGLGVALLLGIGLVIGRQQRHRVQPA